MYVVASVFAYHEKFKEKKQRSIFTKEVDIFAEFDKKCIGLELQTTPLKVVSNIPPNIHLKLLCIQWDSSHHIT